MKKRIFALLLVFMISVCFASCEDEPAVISDDLTDTTENDTPEDNTTVADATDTTLNDTLEDVTTVFDTADTAADTDEIVTSTMTLPTVEEWKALVDADNGWWNDTYDAINALLSGDIDEFERLCGVAPGVYESFRGMVITDYKISFEDIPYYFDPSQSRELPILTIEVTESNSDYLTPGTHELVFDEGLWMTFSKREDMNRPTEYPRAHSYISYLGSDRDFYCVLGENRRQFGLPDFIVGRLNWLAGDYEPRSEEEICEYAEKYLGVDGDTLDIERTLDKVEGGYQLIGRGGGGYEFTVLSEEVIDGINVVTVQFYADYSGIIPSRKVEFHMELLDGEYRPIKTVILEDSDFKTVFWST